MLSYEANITIQASSSIMIPYFEYLIEIFSQESLKLCMVKKNFHLTTLSNSERKYLIDEILKLENNNNIVLHEITQIKELYSSLIYNFSTNISPYSSQTIEETVNKHLNVLLHYNTKKY